MSDGGQGFPQDPPGMLLSSHLSRRKLRVVERDEELREKSRIQGMWKTLVPGQEGQKP